MYFNKTECRIVTVCKYFQVESEPDFSCVTTVKDKRLHGFSFNQYIGQ